MHPSRTIFVDMLPLVRFAVYYYSTTSASYRGRRPQFISRPPIRPGAGPFCEFRQSRLVFNKYARSLARPFVGPRGGNVRRAARGGVEERNGAGRYCSRPRGTRVRLRAAAGPTDALLLYQRSRV